VTHLIADDLLNCHSEDNLRELLKKPASMPTELMQSDRRELDDTIFELIGVANPNERVKLVDELYRQTTAYYRYQRTQDIQSSVNRASAGRVRFGPQDLAEGIWDSLSMEERGIAIPEWIAQRWTNAEKIEIPEGKAKAYGSADMFNSTEVSFKTATATKTIRYAHAAQAELVSRLAGLGITGELALPKSADDCRHCLKELNDRLRQATERFAVLAASRTGNAEMQEKTAALLLHWHIHGRG